MATILETLENAEYNLKHHQTILGFNQLHNATMLLIKGYSIYDNIEIILDGYQTVDTIPEKEPK